LDYYGYVGKILYVDLTSGQIETQQLDENVIKDFLGGWGINYRLEYDLLKPGTDPLSPDNPIIIGAGPLCGTLAIGSGKVTATMKLPIRASKREEKYIVATAVGGSNQFGIMMKNAGYDHIVITGRAKKPSYLKIVDDDIEICDADDLWGKCDVYETSDELANRHRGKTGKAGTWVIGKAGENLVMASLGFVDGLHTMGRWGGAAVLGSKNLKAVVTLGTKGVKVADPKRFMALVDRKRKQIMSHPEFGLPPSESFFETFNLCGIPLGKSPYPGDLFSKTMYASWGCPSCFGPCKTALEIKEGRFAGTTLKTIPVVIYEAEKVGKLRLPHYGEAVKLVDLMHRYGMCMFTGVRMLHFVTRLFERGVISAQDTGGLELRTGDIDSYIRLLEKWVNREGIGDYMAQGWFAISERVGVDAATDFEDGVPIVRGSEVQHDIRWGNYGPGWMLPQVVRPKPGGVHQRASLSAGENIQQSLSEVRRDLVEKTGLPEEEADQMFTANEFNYGRVLKHSEDAEAVFTSLGTCVGGGPDDPGRDMPGLSEIYSAVTGFSATPKELRSKGERIRNMEALLNVREGIMGEDYEPPTLWLEHTEKPIRVATGDLYATDWFGRRITKDEIYKWMRDYYTERGWDINNRIPTREKLRELGLKEFIRVVEPYLANNDPRIE
jgi:aldehyde:ferredoxin oxidoreductase